MKTPISAIKTFLKSKRPQIGRIMKTIGKVCLYTIFAFAIAYLLCSCAPTPCNLLTFNGHYYRDIGKQPCPLENGVDCTVSTNVDGLPAWWQNGHTYVRDPSMDCQNNPWHINWDSAPKVNIAPIVLVILFAVVLLLGRTIKKGVA